MEAAVAMWSRCWWATWLSGFFGIAGALHLVRWVFKVPVTIGETAVPVPASLAIGVALLLVSAGLLWIEVQREHAKKRGTHGP